VFPDDWAVSHREDIDSEAVSDRPPFGHRFVGVWPDIKCVPITNADGTDNIFGRNRSVTVDTVAVHNPGYFVDGLLRMLRARSVAQKRQCELPGFDKNREFKEWVASHGDGYCEPEFGGSRSYRKVTFNDQSQIFEDVEGVPC